MRERGVLGRRVRRHKNTLVFRADPEPPTAVLEEGVHCSVGRPLGWIEEGQSSICESPKSARTAPSIRRCQPQSSRTVQRHSADECNSAYGDVLEPPVLF